MTYELELFTENKLTAEALENAGLQLQLKVSNSGEEIEISKLDSSVPAFLLEPTSAFSQRKFEGFSLGNFQELTIGYASGSDDIDLLYRYLSLLAVQNKGALFDPQIGKLLYPKKARLAETQRVSFDLLSLVWKIPEVVEFGQFDNILSLLAAHLPIAYPMYYGRTSFNKFDNSRVREMYSFFEVDNSIDWTGSGEPLISASLSAPSKVVTRENREGLLSSLICYFDAELMLKSETLSNEIARAFCEIANSLNCLHAFAYLQQGRTKDNAGNIYTGSGEFISTGHTTRWSGIPKIRTWLSWYGEIALGSVGPYLGSNKLENGRLLRFGVVPQSNAQLKSVFPKFPEEILDSSSGDRNAETMEQFWL